MLLSTGRVLRTEESQITVDVQGHAVVAALATHIPGVIPGQRVIVTHGGDHPPLISSAYPLEVVVEPGRNGETPQAAMSFDPETGTLSIQAKQLNLQGMSSIEIRCGESLLRFSAQGEVFMQAEAITQSAVGAYQIEGASIDLN